MREDSLLKEIWGAGDALIRALQQQQGQVEAQDESHSHVPADWEYIWGRYRRDPLITIFREDLWQFMCALGEGEKTQSLSGVPYECQLALQGIRAAVYLAGRYAHSPGDFLDYVQEGFLGLLAAASHYDPGRGARFATYGYYWAWQHITRYRDYDTFIRVPIHLSDSLNKLRRRLWSPEETEDCLPTDVVDFRPDVAVLTAMSIQLGHLPLDYLQCGKSPEGVFEQWALGLEGCEPSVSCSDEILSRCMWEWTTPEDAYLRTEQTQTIQEVLGTINERERNVVELYYGFDGTPRTLEEVGDILGVTRERIRQILQKALRRLRHPQRTKWLR